MKVFVENRDSGVERMFLNNGWELSDSIFNTDLLCLSGGADVSPELYGEVNTHSYTDERRDIHCAGLVAIAQSLRIPIVGICRGSQFLCVALGGSMIQHVDGHSGTIPVDFRGKTYQMPVSHHQQCVPNLGERFVWRSPLGAPEIMIYPGHGYLGFQPHPEYVGKDHSAQKLFFELIREVCFSNDYD